MSACTLCPRRCVVDRTKKRGYCHAPDGFLVARAALHQWEEPCISHIGGSGTVFFAGCNLSCVFCQNHAISRGDAGALISGSRLAEIFLELAEQGAENINLVTPSHYTDRLIPVLRRAKAAGLTLPIVWNSSAYETAESLRALSGLVDVYLPDFKFIDAKTAQRYANAPDYPEVALAAIDEMVRQCPTPVLDENGKMTRGVIVRHLVLPSHVGAAKRALKTLFDRYGNGLYYSIMRQYTPMDTLEEYPELSRPITDREYGKVCAFAAELGIENGFLQEGDSVGESFIPAFDLQGVLQK